MIQLALAQTEGLNHLATKKLTLPSTPLFGTDGIRGKVGDLLNADLALLAGFWAGEVLRELAGTAGTVIIGQDSRNSSNMLADAVSVGLTAAGVDVSYVGLCPTPCVAYLVNTTNAIGGIMISASHNPPEDNGIKFFASNGTKLSAKYTEKIETGIRSISDNVNLLTTSWGKHHHRPSLVKDYLDNLQKSLPSETNFQGMRIVLDLAWGAAVNLAPSIFQALGAEVICLHSLADGDRINVNCGSTHLEVLKAAVLEYSADLGFAFDGDADRVMAVDSQGREVNGDYILYLWGSRLKQENKLPCSLIIATVMSNLGFELAWTSLGGKLIRTAVGDQNVQDQMWRTGAILGGEQSGHILCHDYGVSGDGLQTALHLTAIVKDSGVSLAELVDGSFENYPQILRNVRVEDRDRRLNWRDCQPLQTMIEKAESEMGNQGRVLVRASGTEPLIRVMVEAASHELALTWTEKLVKTVEKYLV